MRMEVSEALKAVRTMISAVTWSYYLSESTRSMLISNSKYGVKEEKQEQYLEGRKGGRTKF